MNVTSWPVTRNGHAYRAVAWGGRVDVIDAEPCDQSGWVGTVYSGPVEGLESAGFVCVSPIAEVS